ncbi:transcriptional regulator [Pilimelia terevasa]|uniref:Glycerol operon regulatory protein n=1 Tax=Pilimelia terevasa TaxID=53372 RepID=A0A8J3FG70_9ACTN|nr:helix-turn-helix domain-containing protein [Pilimelia terevasa]GGK21013.1 transcriptional regulator [Pilimelia terevasa]
MRDPLAEPSDLIRSVSRALRVLEAVGRAPRGLTVKQIARRCELTVATTYHLVRTLAYEGYVSRREDGTYVVGLEIADRFRELVVAFRGPSAVGEVLHRAAADSGHSHLLGRFVGGRVALTAVAEGVRSPRLDEFVPGFDDGAHATAFGKALLATLTSDQRLRYLKDWGMRPFTPSTLTTPETFEADIAAGERRGLQMEIGQFRGGVATAAVVVTAERDLERRLAVACALPAADMMPAARLVRSRLQAVARAVTEAMVADAA